MSYETVLSELNGEGVRTGPGLDLFRFGDQPSVTSRLMS